MSSLEITINYQTSSKARFVTFLNKFQKENDLSLRIERITPYHKIPGQFQATATLETDGKTDAELVYFCLLLTNRFKTSTKGKISVIGPHLSDSGVEFGVILNQENEHSALQWLHIQTA